MQPIGHRHVFLTAFRVRLPYQKKRSSDRKTVFGWTDDAHLPTSVPDAVSCAWTLPRPKNMPPSCFLRPFESASHTKKRDRPLARPFLAGPMMHNCQHPCGCSQLRMDSPTAGKQSTGLFSDPPFESRSSIKKSRYPDGYLDFLVREMGLEPTRRNHTHLKRACLPFQHSRKAY